MKVPSSVVSLALCLFASGSAAQDCAPTRGYKIAVCSASCSGNYCGYNLPHLGKKAFGSFVTYHDRGDSKPIIIPSGASEASNFFRFFAASNTSLHFSLDEIPDLSLGVSVYREDGSGTPFESSGDANESFVLPGLSEASYIIKVRKRRETPGGDTANYVPTIYLLPTIQPDKAGNGKQSAREVGELPSSGAPLVLEDHLQYLTIRNAKGDTGTETSVNDREDWYKIRVPRKGLLKATLAVSPVLAPPGSSPQFGYTTGVLSDDPISIPDTGLAVEKGIAYLVVRVPQSAGGFVDEFGLRYTLSAALGQ